MAEKYKTSKRAKPPKLKGWKGLDTEHKVLIIVATIAAFGAIVAAAVTGLFGLLDSSSANSRAKATFDTPAEVSSVDVDGTISASGTVTDLADGQTLWLMDRDPGSYTADQQAVVVADEWTASSEGPFNNPGQKPPESVEILIVVASEDCNEALNEAVEAEDSTMSSLPPGCRATDSRTVTITSSE